MRFRSPVSLAISLQSSGLGSSTRLVRIEHRVGGACRTRPGSRAPADRAPPPSAFRRRLRSAPGPRRPIRTQARRTGLSLGLAVSTTASRASGGRPGARGGGPRVGRAAARRGGASSSRGVDSGPSGGAGVGSPGALETPARSMISAPSAIPVAMRDLLFRVDDGGSA